jgi:hypothetical protein
MPFRRCGNALRPCTAAARKGPNLAVKSSTSRISSPRGGSGPEGPRALHDRETKQVSSTGAAEGRNNRPRRDHRRGSELARSKASIEAGAVLPSVILRKLA